MIKKSKPCPACGRKPGWGRQHKMEALLVLEDGTVFSGISTTGGFHAAGTVTVNSSVVGYQETATDPSNAGKIIVFTNPIIGNCGASFEFCESDNARAAAVITKYESPAASNWQAETTFNDFLRTEGIPAATGMDTRAVSIHLREKGEMRAVVSAVETDIEKLVSEARGLKPVDHVKATSAQKVKRIAASGGSSIGVIDLGILKSFREQLISLKLDITLLPFNTQPDKILDSRFDGLIISNGPEEGKSLGETAAAVEKLAGRIPMLGIASGAGVICAALGGRQKKLPRAHRGMNYPVKPPDSLRGAITIQNHGWAPEEDSLDRSTRITQINANDGSVEAFENQSLKISGVYYYPLSEGPGEIHPVFLRFVETIRAEKCRNEKT